MYSVSYVKCRKETYVLASGNSYLIDVFRLKDFKKNARTSECSFLGFIYIVKLLLFEFLLTGRPSEIGEAGGIRRIRLSTQDRPRLDVRLQVMGGFEQNQYTSFFISVFLFFS